MTSKNLLLYGLTAQIYLRFLPITIANNYTTTQHEEPFINTSEATKKVE